MCIVGKGIRIWDQYIDVLLGVHLRVALRRVGAHYSTVSEIYLVLYSVC